MLSFAHIRAATEATVNTIAVLREGATAMTDSSTAMTQTPQHSWRELFLIDPSADALPMMADAIIDGLAANIKEHGLQKPVQLLGTRDEKGPYVVIDGRNRLEAMERLGVEFDPEHPEATKVHCRSGISPFEFVGTVVDKAEYVIAANIKRRHLTKAEQVEKALLAIRAGQPNDLANMARSFSPTSGKKGGSTKDPVIAKTVALFKEEGVSERTIRRVDARLKGRTTTSTIAPTVTLTLPPPSTYEWVDAELTKLRKARHRTLKENRDTNLRYKELDLSAPGLTPAERRTVLHDLVADRRDFNHDMDAAIVHFGGRREKREKLPPSETSDLEKRSDLDEQQGVI